MNGIRQPDLIVTQALCNVCAVAEHEVNAAACSLPGSPRVIILEPTCLQEIFDCLTEIGAAVGIEEKAREVIEGSSRGDDLAAAGDVWKAGSDSDC